MPIQTKHNPSQEQGLSLDLDTILDTATGRLVTYSQLIDQLATVPVVYVGEQHLNRHHHDIQLRIIQSLAERKKDLAIGLEMFDRSYQPKLDRWVQGDWQWPQFLKAVHWYANWKYDADLYKPILMLAQENHMAVVGLNLPFHIPPKIAQGGINSLLPGERAWLPDTVDTSNVAHRAYLEEIFKLHRFPGQDDFEAFYQAQCAWEDTMAVSIARRFDQTHHPMVVLAGNGHIIRKFGIPDRVFKRTQVPFRTLILATPDTPITAADGDFIWMTAAVARHPF